MKAGAETAKTNYSKRCRNEIFAEKLACDEKYMIM